MINLSKTIKKYKKRWFINSLLIIGSLLFSLFLAEIVLRILGISYPHFYQTDSLVGHRLNPGTGGWFRTEGNAYITINKAGWRDRDHLKEKPANTIRIAVLGDSYAEALQVPLEETFWFIMGQHMNMRRCFGNKTVEVLNFGVSGYGTTQEFLILQHYVWEYSPNIVLLTFFTGNDIRNNSKILETQKYRPFFMFRDEVLELDNSLVHKQKTSWLGAFRQTLYRRFRIYQLFSKLKKLCISGKQNIHNESIQGEESGLDTMVYREPESPDWQEAWKITEALLVKMSHEIKKHNTRFVVVILSTGIQVHPDPKVQSKFMERLAIENLLYPDMRIKTFLEQEEIEVLSLAPLFQNYAEEHNVFLHGFENSELGFGHWNTYGHRLAGETIAAYFCSKN